MILDFNIIWNAIPPLLAATVTTLQLSVWILAVGLLLGIPIGILNIGNSRILRWLTEFYILIFRGTPPLVQLFIVYFGLAQFEAVRESFMWPLLRNAFWCAVIALGLNSGAYVARMFAGALKAIPVGQIEAAKALGMGPVAAFLTVRAPLAFRAMLPSYCNEVIMTVKATALASTITVQELMGRARSEVSDTYAPYEVLISTALIYLALTYSLTWAFDRLERHLNPTRPELQPATTKPANASAKG